MFKVKKKTTGQYDFCFVVHHVTVFNALTAKRGFEVFSKMTIGNLCKQFHDLIVIPYTLFYCFDC